VDAGKATNRKENCQTGGVSGLSSRADAEKNRLNRDISHVQVLLFLAIGVLKQSLC
jgi:hypothetical protein